MTIAFAHTCVGGASSSRSGRICCILAGVRPGAGRRRWTSGGRGSSTSSRSSRRSGRNAQSVSALPRPGHPGSRSVPASRGKTSRHPRIVRRDGTARRRLHRGCISGTATGRGMIRSDLRGDDGKTLTPRGGKACRRAGAKDRYGLKAFAVITTATNAIVCPPVDHRRLSPRRSRGSRPPRRVPERSPRASRDSTTTRDRPRR